MGELRDLRRAVDLRQDEFAALLAVPLETLRTWDSGRRPPPAHVVQRARQVVAARPSDTELLSLDQLARELGVHQRTLRAAARTGRIDVQFSSKSVFGRPVRYATRAAGVRFMEAHYRLFAGQQFCPAPLPSVPADFDERLKWLRRRLGFSQHELARRVGAAGKAVVYQWESRRRVPSPVFWRKVEELDAPLRSVARGHVRRSMDQTRPSTATEPNRSSTRS
jgi:DNA-binding transcriptional regulator YiaG